MKSTSPIHDLYFKSLPSAAGDSGTRTLILTDQDHLLRRFGLAEAVRLPVGKTTGLRLRAVADEAWALLEGRAEFAWHDLRPGSPTHDRWHRWVAARPALVLAPFGVAFGAQALAGPALLLRLATHADGAHDGDLILPWESAV